MRSLWTLGGAVVGALLGYAACTSRDTYWASLIGISVTAAAGAVVGWSWSWRGNGGDRA